MSFTNVFGGNTIYPSDVSYLALALSANNPLEWPLESSGTEDPAARIIDVTPSASGFSVILPDATLTGAGQTILFNNVSGAYSFFVKDYAGNTLTTVGFGEQWQLYLAGTATAAGTWRVFRFGASTATVQPSALAGFGITVTSSTLSQSLPVTTFSTSGTTLSSSSRAGAAVWIGSGAGTLNLPAAASVANNYFVLVRNAGGGDLTLDPSGAETVNGAATLTFRPGDSATVITDGATWYTVGFGQDAVFAFDYTSISVTGGTVTLAGSQLNRIAYKFINDLVNPPVTDVTVVVPSTTQQYWINNATSGSFNFYVKTSGGPATQVQQGAKGIYYCDGTNVVLASDPTTLTTPISITQGGTSATTASAARLALGISSFADAIVTATTAASVRTTISAAASGANGDITSLTGLTTPLSLVQGGTNATTAPAARLSIGISSFADAIVTATTAASVRGTISAAVSGANGDITALSALGSGTVGTPSIRFTADATTGVFLPAAGQVALAAGGVARVTGNATGVALTGAVTASSTVAITGSDLTVGAGNLLLQFAAGNGFIRSQTGALNIGANATTYLNIGTAGVITEQPSNLELGYKDVPQNAQSGAYTLVASDRGKHIYCTGGAAAVTIPPNSSVSLLNGAAVTVVNDGSGARTITQGAGVTLKWAGPGTTGNRTLAVGGMATLLKVGTDTWYISGAGIT